MLFRPIDFFVMLNYRILIVQEENNVALQN